MGRSSERWRQVIVAGGARRCVVGEMHHSGAIVVAEQIEVIVGNGELGCALLRWHRLRTASRRGNQIGPGLIEVRMGSGDTSAPVFARGTARANERRRGQAAVGEVAIGKV